MRCRLPRRLVVLIALSVPACTALVDVNGLSGAVQSAGEGGAPSTDAGCTADVLFCDDFDHEQFSEKWSSKELGNAMFTPEGGVERSPFATAPSPPNTLLVYHATGRQGAVEGPLLKKVLPMGDYTTVRVAFDMLIEEWSPSTTGSGCCAFFPFALGSHFDAGIYHLTVGNGSLSWDRSATPESPAGTNQLAPLFDPFVVGEWTHVEVVLSGVGSAREAILRVNGAKQATLSVPADLPRPEVPPELTFGIALVYAPATARVRYDNVMVDTK